MAAKSNITVLYENLAAPDENFDFDYYILKHMSLVEKAWKPAGIEAWQVIRFEKTIDGATPPYLAMAVVTFNGQDGANLALTLKETPEVVGDVPNFTNLKPILMLGDVAGTSA
jgi:uncharacterized protein (TIGR02118 family)